MKKGLQAKDFITIGLYTVLFYIISMIVGMVVAPVAVASIPYQAGLLFFFGSIVYLLMAIRVGKRGTIFSMGIILGLIYAVMGAPLMIVIAGCAALLSELILAKGDGSQYRNIGRQSVAYSIFGIFYGLGSYMNIYLFGKESLEKMQMSPDMVNQLVTYAYSPLWLTISISFTIVMALLGCFLSKKLLRKHFVKAGYIQYG